jgi:AraC-like DNA-binding protein
VGVRTDFEPQHALLRRFVRLKTRDAGELSHTISWARPHRFELSSNRGSPHSELRYAQLQRGSAGFLACEVGFCDRIGASDSTFSLLLVFGGTGEHSVGKKRYPLTRAHAAVHSAGQAVEVCTSGPSEMVSLTLSTSAMIRELENQLGRPIQAPLEFAPSVSMDSVAGLKLRRLAVQLCAMLDGSREARGALTLAQLERSLVSHLIDSQRHNYSRLLNRGLLAAPWQVRAAEEFVYANATRPLSSGDIASVAGVSVRTLQYSFERHRGISPMDFLRQVRLQHAREELLVGDKATTVSDAAMRSGFSHLGRFAAEYKKRFRESPSATLRRPARKRPQ